MLTITTETKTIPFGIFSPVRPRKILMDDFEYPTVLHAIYGLSFLSREQSVFLNQFSKPVDISKTYSIMWRDVLTEVYKLSTQRVLSSVFSQIRKHIPPQTEHVFYVSTKSSPSTDHSYLGVNSQYNGFNYVGKTLESLLYPRRDSQEYMMNVYAIKRATDLLLKFLSTGDSIEEFMDKSSSEILLMMGITPKQFHTEYMDVGNVFEVQFRTKKVDHYKYILLELHYPNNLARFLLRDQCVYLNYRLLSYIQRFLMVEIGIHLMRESNPKLYSENMIRLRVNEYLDQSPEQNEIMGKQVLELYLEQKINVHKDTFKKIEHIRKELLSPSKVEFLKNQLPKNPVPTEKQVQDTTVLIVRPDHPLFQVSVQMDQLTFRSVLQAIHYWVFVSLGMSTDMAYNYATDPHNEMDRSLEEWYVTVFHRNLRRIFGFLMETDDSFLECVYILDTLGFTGVDFVYSFDSYLGMDPQKRPGFTNLYGEELNKSRLYLSKSQKTQFAFLRDLTDSDPLLMLQYNVRFRDILYAVKHYNRIHEYASMTDLSQWEDLLRTYYKTYEQVYKILQRQRSATVVPEAVRQCLADYYRHVISNEEIIEHLFHILSFIYKRLTQKHGSKLGTFILSNQPKEFTEEVQKEKNWRIHSFLSDLLRQFPSTGPTPDQVSAIGALLLSHPEPLILPKTVFFFPDGDYFFLYSPSDSNEMMFSLDISPETLGNLYFLQHTLMYDLTPGRYRFLF